MNRRHIGYAGIGAWVIFWAASIIFGALRPTYSHVVNTISELGAVGTPYAGLWNLIGFGLTGLLLAVVGVALALESVPRSSLSRLIAALFLAVAGLAIAGQGLFSAEMLNGVADVSSTSTRAHFISSLISGGAWAVGALVLAGPMKRSSDWRGFHLVTIALVILVLLASFVLGGTLPDGLAQRIGNAFFCLWYVVMCLRLVSLDRHQA